MENKKIFGCIGAGLVIAGLVTVLLIIFLTPEGVKVQNEYEESMTKADFESDYKTSLETETTLRSYKASYEADKITYESNKTDDTAEGKELARAAKTRANRTAATYNELLNHSILEHIRFPEELTNELPYLD